MKNLLSLLFVPFFMNAQEPQKPTTTTTTTTISTTISSETNKPSIFTKKHEVRFAAVRLLAGPVFEGTYEYIHTKYFTFGGSMQVSLMSTEIEEKFSITPFARFYFTETKEYGAKGFFVEGFAKYFTGVYNKNSSVLWNNYNIPYTFNSFALGLSLGKKWVNSSGFVFEGLLGGGRTIGSDEKQPSGIFRGDLNIGYRF